MSTSPTFLDSQAEMVALRRRATLYMMAIVAAEILLVVAGPIPSLMIHGILLVVLAFQTASLESPHRQVFSALMLHPLLRVISLGLPSRGLPPLLQYVLVGFPMLVGIVLMVRAVKLTAKDIGLVRKIGWRQFAFGLVGWPLGLIAALLVRPTPAITSLTPVNLTAGIIVITVFSSSIEELLFRGVLQTTLYQYFGNYGILCTSLLFVSAYLGTLSVPYVVFMGLVGLGFAWFTQRSGSLWGVLIAHSLFKCGALLIWPYLLR